MEHNGKQDSGKERFFMPVRGENVSVKGETVTAEGAEAATGAGREQFCMRRWAKMRFGGQRGAWKRFGALGVALMIIAAAGAAVYTAGYTDWNEPALNAEKILAQSKLGGRTFKGEPPYITPPASRRSAICKTSSTRWAARCGRI